MVYRKLGISPGANVQIVEQLDGIPVVHYFKLAGMILQSLPSILSFYLVLLLVNLPAPFLGLKFENNDARRLWYEPPGFIIPIVWFVLFTLLGLARHTLIVSNAVSLQWWLYALAVMCAAYAYYTLGLAQLTQISALWFGLWGNLLVILFAALVVYQLQMVSMRAAWLTLPVIIWTLYATWIVLGTMKAEGLVG